MRSALFAALPALLLPAITSAYSGDMTYYTPGLGSCGITNNSNDLVVALSIPMMGNGANPNNNPKCGSWIGIWNPVTKTKHEAQVVDTCFACHYTDIDVSPALFKLVAPDGDGRVHGIDWGGPMRIETTGKIRRALGAIVLGVRLSMLKHERSRLSQLYLLIEPLLK
ncbi:MAG: hypothetical protein Q9203_002692 [Teloschistes exilis]